MHQHRRSISRPSLVLAGALLLGVLGAGCSSASSERHYFRSLDDKNQPVNYFRLTINSSSSLASSRYLSGWFDETAVNQYFGDFTQPRSLGNVVGAAPETPAPSTGGGGGGAAGGSREKEVMNVELPAGDGATRVEALGSNADGRKLVILMSSNSDDIASQITTIADGAVVSSFIATIAAKDTLSGAAEARARLDAHRQGARIASKLADANLKEATLKTETPAEVQQTQAALLQVGNQFAVSLGAPAPFATMGELRAWLNANRARLLND